MRFLCSFSFLGRVAFGIGLVGFANSAYSQGNSEAERLIKEIKDKAESHRYAAVREAFIRNHKGELVKIEERVLRSRTRQKIEYPPNSPFAGQVVLDEGGKRQTYFKATNEIRESRTHRFRDHFDFEQMKRRGEQLAWSVRPGGRVAGQDTRQIDLQIDGKTRQSMWVIVSRSLVVKRHFFDGKGEMVGGFEYKRINFSPDLRASMFELPASARVVSPLDDLKRLAKEMGMTPYTLESRSGYQLMQARNTEVMGKKGLRQFFDAGNSRVSLVQIKDLEATGFRKEGRMSVYSWRHQGVTLMLIGELDERGMRRLASLVGAAQLD